MCFHNRLFSTLEFHNFCRLIVFPQSSLFHIGISPHLPINCVSTIVSIPRWNFITFFGLPMFYNIRRLLNFTTVKFIHCLKSLRIPHRDAFGRSYNLVRFCDKSCLYSTFGISSSSPFKLLFHNLSLSRIGIPTDFKLDLWSHK